jgi:P-type Cu+ transporter
MTETQIQNDLKCFHCGQPCEDETLWMNEKSFCCFGCRTVYEILDSNNLCEYYDLEKMPGHQLKKTNSETFAYLNEPDIRKKLLSFDSETFSKVEFFVPAIHCVSCIWLLENLRKLDKGILHSEVNFSKKTIVVDFNPKRVTPGTIVTLLNSVGYAPKISLENNDAKSKKIDKRLVLKLALAGFAFGNVMLFSFPEYLGIDHSEENLMRIFSWLNLGLSVPVFFYSASDYLTAVIKSFKQKQINIDVPIAAGLIALFTRSTYEIVMATGPGYFDSFTGLVFFLLIGRWFQSLTYESLAFDRDFTSYFPLAVNRLEDGEWKPVVIYKLSKGNEIKIRNMELVPADSILQNDKAYIDYSFVTGESRPVKVLKDNLVYAGGRLIGSPLTLTVNKSTSQSHLTSLWNNDAFKKTEESNYQKIIDRAARKFTWIVLAIALATAIYWQITAPSSMWLVLTSVLMVACPCALALAAPFTFGSMLRVFGRNNLYLKNADVIERMATIDTIVFDKTGTVTHGKDPEVKFIGELSETDKLRVKLLTGFSTHPLSMLIHRSIKGNSNDEVNEFKELPGKGIEACIDERKYKIGSPQFVNSTDTVNANASRVYISIDEQVKGYFEINVSVRKDLPTLLLHLGKKVRALLSGDRDVERQQMRTLFGEDVDLRFEQSPYDKLHYIRDLQNEGRSVMMVGDGLNDAGAIKQSNVGVAVTDDTGVFTPACDGILSGDKICLLDRMLSFAKSSSWILKFGFSISFFYNAIALTFAVTGNLTPLVAAIIMPISSISVVGFSTLAVKFSASRFKL